MTSTGASGSDRLLPKQQLEATDDNGVHLVWSDACTVDNAGDPSHYLYETMGEIRQFDDGGENEVLVGKFGLFYVDIRRASSAGVALFDVCDTDSTTIGYFESLYFPAEPHLNRRASSLLQYDTPAGNLLIIDRLEVMPKFRGRGIGLRVMAEMIGRFGAGASVVAIKPFPLQFETAGSVDGWCASLELNRLPRSIRSATAKLRDHYASLGFVRVPRTPYMIKSLD